MKLCTDYGFVYCRIAEYLNVSRPEMGFDSYRFVRSY